LKNFKNPPKVIELFHFLRSLCNDQNPHESGLVNVTASSVYDNDPIHQPHNVLNFDTNSFWLTKNDPNNWIMFDLKGKSFQMKQICIHAREKYFARNWTLEGSNNNSTWTIVHNQGEDERFNTPDAQVTFNINSQQSFTIFKIVQKNHCYGSGHHYMDCYSIEFIGILS
jgi:hypothetical protein